MQRAGQRLRAVSLAFSEPLISALDACAPLLASYVHAACRDLRSGGLVSGAQGLSAELSVLTTLSQLYVLLRTACSKAPPLPLEMTRISFEFRVLLYHFRYLQSNNLKGTLPPEYSAWNSLTKMCGPINTGGQGAASSLGGGEA